MIAASRIRSEATESAQSKIRNKTFSLHAIPLSVQLKLQARSQTMAQYVSDSGRIYNRKQTIREKKMVDREHLDNAPITEALIDIRVENTDEFTIDKLEQITKLLPEDYTDIKPQNRILTEIQINTDDNPEFEVSKNVKDHIGYICWTSNKKNVAQVRLDGFTFSELKPYSEWSIFSKRAKQIWDVFCSGTNCQSISRLAVRYINHLELPITVGKNFNKYLTAAPSIPKALPQSINEFLTRVAILGPENGLVAHVTQALLPTLNKNTISILLDIDVFMPLGNSPLSEEIWTKLEILKQFENDIFFNYITKETKELFK